MEAFVDWLPTGLPSVTASMEPEDIFKGRVFTWSVLVTEFVIGLIVMVVLAGADPGLFSKAELESQPTDIQEMMRAEWEAARDASATANVVGPIYFVFITGLSLAVLGGNWTFRIIYGVFLIILAGVTCAAPWLSPHRVVMTADTVPIIFCSVFALLHLAGGLVMLVFKPVRLFLHPRRMLFSAPADVRR